MGGGPDQECMLIASPLDLPPELIAETRRRFPYIEVITCKLAFGGSPLDKNSVKTVSDCIERVTILVTFNSLPPTHKDAPNLHLIHFTSAGIERFVDHPIIKDTDIAVTTSSGIHGPPISEWVLMTTLVLTKGYNLMHEHQKMHKWDQMGTGALKATDWTEKTVGIAGYGSIGRQVARTFKAMGANVHAYTATPRSTVEARADDGYIIPNTGDPDGSIPDAWYSGTSTESLHTFLRSGLDLLVISLPLTPSTRHLFSTAEFAILGAGGGGPSHKKSTGCILVNISRGPIVDQPALVVALNDGVLRGAALDVTDPEPLPAEDPLWDARNCIVTPHVSAMGSEYFGRAFDVLLTNLGRRERGERLFNLVDRKKGY